MFAVTFLLMPPGRFSHGFVSLCRGAEGGLTPSLSPVQIVQAAFAGLHATGHESALGWNTLSVDPWRHAAPHSFR